MSRLAEAIEAIDTLHAEDPRRTPEGSPRELDYARRMTSSLAKLVEDPSDALQLAVRAQHLQRWLLPRDRYPMTRRGYYRWRDAQKAAHAQLAVETLRRMGYDEPTIERVASLVRKENLRGDPEAQALEDAACLVFLQTQLAGFAEGRDEVELAGIVRKTWAKMSADGQAAARALALDEGVRELLDHALA